MEDRKIRIAIADDANLICSAFTSVINKFQNCEVILIAHDGNQLIQDLTTLEQLPDVCIIETNNRILYNFKTLIELQTLFPQIKLLALSSFELEYTIMKIIQHGVRGYLLKSCGVDQLEAAINHVHTNDYYYSAIAPLSLFVKARNETLPELTEDELKLLSLAVGKLNKEKKISATFIQESILDDSYYPIIEKLNLNNYLGLALYMMQIGLLPGKHF